MNEKILYLECYSGISGDMTVAALLDLGADQQLLLDGLDSLKVGGYRIEIGRRLKNSIDACDFNVILEEDDYLLQANEKEHAPNHELKHSHGHNLQKHNNDHDHGHTHQSHMVLGHHEHRNLNEIYSIIDQSGISDNAKNLSKKIFYIIAVAEAKAHAKNIEEVHFHEVGAIDSIVDIVATAICLDNLKIKKAIVSELYEGTGQIKCQHGFLPVPVPGVSNIASDYNLSLHITNVKGELVTPTGAAIVAAIKTGNTLPKEMKIHKIGLGAGKREYPDTSGILRAMLIEEATSPITPSTDQVWVLEANIDDCSGEALAFTMELLFQKGAKDVYYSPIFMKKNRPAYLLGVICSDENVSELESIIFMHTTTIGIRKHKSERTILQREQKLVITPYGEAFVKVCTFQGQKYIYPEYESVKSLCIKAEQDYMTMYHDIQQAAKECL